MAELSILEDFAKKFGEKRAQSLETRAGKSAIGLNGRGTLGGNAFAAARDAFKSDAHTDTAKWLLGGALGAAAITGGSAIADASSNHPTIGVIGGAALAGIAMYRPGLAGEKKLAQTLAEKAEMRTSAGLPGQALSPTASQVIANNMNKKASSTAERAVERSKQETPAYKAPVAPHEPIESPNSGNIGTSNSILDHMGASTEIPSRSNPSESRYSSTGNRANRSKVRYKGQAAESAF